MIISRYQNLIDYFPNVKLSTISVILGDMNIEYLDLFYENLP
jgi:hypothetical protein